jgi:hypothetical protein
VDSFILRHQDDLSETTSTPQKGKRLKAPLAFLDETTSCLREYVHGMKAKLVFSLNEVGISEWEDRKPKKVVVPKIIAEETVHFLVSQGVKYLSIVSCTKIAVTFALARLSS